MERILSREEFTPHTKCKLLQRGGGVIDVTRCEFSGHGSTFCFHVNNSTFLGFTGGQKTSSWRTQQHPPTHTNPAKISARILMINACTMQVKSCEHNKIIAASTHTSGFCIIFIFNVAPARTYDIVKLKLTPPLPQPLKLPGWKMHRRAYKQCISRSNSTSTFNAMRFYDNPFACQCEKESEKGYMFQISHFY